MKYTLSAALYISALLYGSCKTMQAYRPAPADGGSAAAVMSCKIEGRIVEIMNTRDEDTGSICSKYPCKARVLIMDVLGCGSSASLALAGGDTVEIRFVYTLHSTSGIFPGMKAHYPGLRRGDVFIANTEQRLKVGGTQLIIYDYDLKK